MIAPSPVAAPPSAREVLIACHDLAVTYENGASCTRALGGVSLSITDGERVAIWGRSGSGKTTLLHALGGLVGASAGSVVWLGRPLATLDVAARAAIRAQGIAYVFQGASLLPSFTAIENVRFAARHAAARPAASATPEALLALVGLAGKEHHLPSELSGGEAQRVAIARALAGQPRLLLCDEPTGQLDRDTADRTLRLLEVIQQRFGFALLVATHDLDVVARFPREIELADGVVLRDEEHR